ncbi:MAG: LamG-like jellyroll fold domain-containing protein [Bacteroidales bacterium]|nr:LamG-like jellyroll fold domain-containing protein [Bacteroidales bacterium]
MKKLFSTLFCLSFTLCYAQTGTSGSHLDAGVTITSNATDNTTCSGTSVTFTATPSGTDATNYQWKKNGIAVSGATNSTFTTSDLVNGDAITVQLSVNSGTVVTANSVLNLDAGNPSSYPGTGSTWTDLSGNDNHATLPSALAASYSSTIGLGSFNFQASSAYAIQSSAMNNWNITTSDALTVETWIKRTNYGNYQFWFSTPDLYYRLGVDPSGYLFWDMAHYVDRSVGVLVSENVWHHIVYTAGKESGNITTRVYLDGELKATQNEGITDLSSFTNYLLGDGQTPGWHPLNGNMGLMRVYNSTLTAADILQNYTAEVDRFTNGAFVSNTLTMTVNNPPVITITSDVPTSICNGSSVTLTALGGGNSIGFNGSNKITFTSTPTIPVANSTYTIEAWVKPNSVSGANGIVGWGNWGNTNQVNALRFNGSTQLINYWWDNDLVVNIPNALDGNWHHVAATFDGTTRSIYWDGELMGSNFPGGHNVPISNNLNIAATNNGEYFDGAIDEVRIWSVGRSEVQIQDNMNSVIPENSAGLAAYYRFDEGTGTVAADATGNANTGTLTNSPVWVTPSTAPISFPAAADLVWSSGATTSSITVSTAGTYTVTATSGDGCTGSEDISVTVNPLPVPEISGLTTVSSGQSNVTYTTAAGMTNYNWTVTGGTASAGGGTSDNTITIDWVDSGTGHVEVNYTNSSGCSAAAQTDLAVYIISKTSQQAGSWNEASTWTPSGVPESTENVMVLHTIIVNNTPTAVCNSLTISSGSVTVNTDRSLTVSSTLTNHVSNTGLVVNSGGSLIQNTANVAATVKRAITGDDKYHLLISPVNESVVADAASCFTGAYVDRYQESAGEWVRLATGDNVVSDYGYSINFANGTPELIFPGTLKTSPVNYANLSYTAAAPGYGSGWNLVGNPYPCGINTALLTVPTGINATTYVWDETGSGNYITLTIGDGSATPGIIAPMQGFFVNTSSATNSLTLANAAKVHGGIFYKSSNTVPQMLTLSIAGNGYSDKTYVRFDQAATENFDQSLDAYKLSGLDEAPQLYSILPDEKAAINTLPSFAANQHVPLGLKVGTTATYTINVEGINSFEPSIPISLHDIKLETSVDLRLNPEYSFTASPGDAENRFKLSFATITGLTKPEASGVNVTAAKGIIRVACKDVNSGKVYLYSTAGQLLATSILTSGKATLSVASTGVYLVKVVNGKTSHTRKLVVLQ